MGHDGAIGKKRERKMQKLCFILFGLIITTGAFAADLCVRNDAMVVAMDPLFNGTVASYDNTTKVWSTRFSYGTISGIGACADDCRPTQGCVATNQNMNVYSVGNACYCKMLRPAPSRWVFSGVGYNGPTQCATDCASRCASNVASSVPLRRGLFRSINAAD